MTAQITEASERPILKSKVFLYVTEFFSGMSVMAAELGASRLLAPYFSSSQIVWTIIIGTIMIALALGAVFGGHWTDKDPNPEDLEWYMEEVASRFRKVSEPDSSSTILTDDKAPVEVLGMHAIDQIIAEEAGPYRQILKDEGIGGLLRAVQ